jgi:hypothetical protein
MSSEIYKYFIKSPSPSEIEIEADGVKIKLLKKCFVSAIEQAEIQEVVYTEKVLKSQLETWQVIVEIAELEKVEEEVIENWLSNPSGNKKLSIKYADKLISLLNSEKREQNLKELAIFVKHRWLNGEAPGLKELYAFPINLLSKISEFLGEERGK